MDRRAWLAQRRAALRADYDDPMYERDGYPHPEHWAFVAMLIETCPANGLLLDAPGGTGPYFAPVREAGRRVVRLDQSTGMLALARVKGLAEALFQGPCRSSLSSR